MEVQGLSEQEGERVGIGERPATCHLPPVRLSCSHVVNAVYECFHG